MQTTTTDPAEFLRNYTASDWCEIYCNCSSIGGKIEIDPKAKIRLQLIEHVLSHPKDASTELLRDLFSFEAEHSEHTQAVHSKLDELATIMLEQSQGSLAMDFLEGLERTFDTQMALRNLPLSDRTRNAALIRLQKIKQDTKNIHNELIEFGLNYFSEKRT